mmetsp:Transcript_34330/g.87797  ORF Transcript_34330/g.87797 Transcript_34330/m.87797 type:complete len:213 (+) Transcript_34330:439-1077(+)
MGGADKAKGFVQVHHGAVKLEEVLVLEVVRVREVPAAAALVQGAAVAGDELAGGGAVRVVAREVDPLGVAELIAHEVEVRLAAQGHGDQADHLVQRNSAVHSGRAGAKAGRCHEVVHVLVHQPERDCLVAHQRLVVALRVADAGLCVPAVGHGVADVAHVPAPVVHGHDLDPLVGDGHLQAVVKAHAALADRAAEGGHAADVLADGDGLGEE